MAPAASKPASDDAHRPQVPGRDEIVAAAVEVVAAESLTAVTFDRLAAELGVTPDRVREFFATPEELVVEAFHAAASQDLHEAREAAAAAPTPADAVWALMDFNIDAGGLSAAWLDAWGMSRHVPGMADELGTMNTLWLDFLRELIEAGQDAGQFHVDDTEVAARWMLLITDGLESQKLSRALGLDGLRRTAQAYVNSLGVSVVEQAKLAALGTLTAGVAHEMKNPLNFVVNFTELNLELCDELRDGISDDYREVFADLAINLDLVLRHAKRALAVIETMLKVGRSGTTVEARACRLNQIVEQSTALAEHSWRINHPGVRCTVERTLDHDDPKVFGFEGDLVQVVINLVMNALEAASSDPDADPRVSVVVRHDQLSVYVEVSDTGPGIPPKIMARIFEPFFTTKNARGGTGLGLSICKDIIDNRHGGELTVTSTPGFGAQFCARLPKEIGA